jgi:hypothetical protein
MHIVSSHRTLERQDVPNRDSLNNSRRRGIRRPFIIAIFLFTLGVYSYPALATWAKTGYTGSSPILASDVGFYVLTSKVTTLSNGRILNPYYGLQVQPTGVPHLQFRLAFQLFGYVNNLFAGHLWLALFVWNLFWWGLLCWIVIWLFEQFLPDNSSLLVTLGFGFLLWSNFGLLKPLVLAWIHLPSLQGFETVGLAYARPFFVQLPVPLLLAYLGLQMSLLRSPRFQIWAWMGLLQFLAFAIFPYATLMMAGITMVATVWLMVARVHSVRWRSLAAYAIFCATVDSLYLLHGRAAHQPQAQPLVFHLEIAVLPHLIGGMWIILGFLTLATVLVRALPAVVKWPLAGLGLSTMTLLLADVFDNSLSISHHAGYFVHTTVGVLLTFILSALCARPGPAARYSRFALGTVVILLAANAMLLAAATYRTFLPLNQQLAETASLLKSIPVTASDFLIVPAKFADDTCEWVPLVSTARVLYCRNAAGLLPQNQDNTIQRLRQGLYLYFTGMDSRQLEAIAEDPNAVEEQIRIAYYGGGVTPFRKDVREEGLSAIRTQLIPWLDAAEHQDPRLHNLIRSYSRILVIDNRKVPVFDRQRLASYLTIQKEVPSGDLTVLFCSPK